MILYYPFAIYLAYCVYSESAKATQYYHTAVSYLDVASQSELAWKSFLEALSLNLYEGASKIQDEITSVSVQAATALQNATYFSLGFSLLSALFFFYIVLIKKVSKETILLNLICVAFICLAIGLTSTMLSLIAFRDVPVLGMVVFKFEAKSIFSVLHTFWLNQKYLVLLLVFLFSVMVPMVKLLLSFSVLINIQGRYKEKMLNIIHAIGKWSMTDVFVVAVLLAFFTMNVDKSTDAWLGHGLYFFTSYSVLSIVIGHYLQTKDDLTTSS